MYTDPREFRDDMRLIWQNCRTYNQADTPVRKFGESLSESWEKKWAQSLIEQKWAEELARQRQETLALVGALRQPAVPAPASCPAEVAAAWATGG